MSIFWPGLSGYLWSGPTVGRPKSLGNISHATAWLAIVSIERLPVDDPSFLIKKDVLIAIHCPSRDQ